jgi:hypothetical protein
MAYNRGPFDNAILQAADDVQATGIKNDDDLLKLLQSISDMAKVPNNVAVSKVNTKDDLNAENIEMPRVIKLPTTEDVDKDLVMEMAKSYREDAKLATTLVTFANDIGEEHEKQVHSSQFMKELSRVAIPQIVARSVTFPSVEQSNNPGCISWHVLSVRI